MGKGWLTEDEVQDLREWTFDIDVDDPRFLTEYSKEQNRFILKTLFSSGHLEGFEIGINWKARFSSFFQDESR